MATRKYNVSFPKRISEDKDKKQFIHIQVGRAFENEDGHINLELNSIPINWDGRLRLWVKDESL